MNRLMETLVFIMGFGERIVRFRSLRAFYLFEQGLS
jgi:hypothetical protein